MLVCPIRVVKRYADLTLAELSDLAVASQRVSNMVQAHFRGTSLTMAIQDGPEAGQTVEVCCGRAVMLLSMHYLTSFPQHVHMHIIPRHKGDYTSNDDIYKDVS